MTIKIISRWEASQMVPEIEFRMWRQLKGAFGINELIMVPSIYGWDNSWLTMRDTMEEALMLVDAKTLCFLEPKGIHSVSDLPDGDITLVLGNTANSNMKFAKADQTYRIDAPSGSTKAHLYGINAAAIALAVRWGQ